MPRSPAVQAAVRDPKRLPIALVTYVGWTLVNVFGMRWASDGTKKPLVETMTHGISWNFAIDTWLATD